ncbi:MAG: polysaccharide deacetylase family protein [Bacteroidota bacterium]
MKSFVQAAIRGAHAVFADRGLPNRLPLYFHSLEPHEYEAFERAIVWTRSEGYRFVAGPRAFLGAPEGERVAWVSFDDNYRAWHQALPLLDRLGIAATFYTNTGVFRDRATPAALDAYFDRIDHHGDRTSLTTAELREIAAAGHVIGAHTHTHRCLADLPFEEAVAEIDRSQRELEVLLEAPVEHFSYPFGMRRHFTEDLRRYCTTRFETVANAIPAMLHAPQRADALQRAGWHLDRPHEQNVRALRIDGRRFEALTGRSAVG